MNNLLYTSNTVFLSEWKIMHFVTLTFRDNLFADSQSVILHNSIINKCSSAGFPLISQNSVVSSQQTVANGFASESDPLNLLSCSNFQPKTSSVYVMKVYPSSDT